MSSQLQPFIATEDELRLANRLLEINNWKRSDSLSLDKALGIFKQTGLSFKQLREIWTIADKDGAGSLNRDELTVAIRLMGWVQAGANLSEGLLAQQGPLPHIKGIVDSPAEKGLPNITSTDIAEFVAVFNTLDPVNGRLNRSRVKEVYLQSGISWSHVEEIMFHFSDKKASVYFNDFALGLHLARTLKSGLISSLPSKIPPEVYKALVLHKLEAEAPHMQASPMRALPFIIVPGDEAPTSPELSVGPNSELQRYMEIIEKTGYIPGKMVLELEKKYGIKPSELAILWSRSQASTGDRPSSEKMISFRSALHKLLSEKTTRQQSSSRPPNIMLDSDPVENVDEESRFSTVQSGLPRRASFSTLNSTTISRAPAPQPIVLEPAASSAITEKAHIRAYNEAMDTVRRTQNLDSPLEDRSSSPIVRHEPLSPERHAQDTPPREVVNNAPPFRPSTLPPTSDPPAYTPPLRLRQAPLTSAVRAADSFGREELRDLREEMARLISRLEHMDTERQVFQRDLQRNRDLQKQLDRSQAGERWLERELQQRIGEIAELQDLVSSLRRENLQHQAQLDERQEMLDKAVRDRDEFRETVDTQEKQIAELTDLVSDLGKAIPLPPTRLYNSGMRILFLRASLRSAEAASENAVQEANILRRKTQTQEQQILELQQRLADMEANNQWTILRKEVQKGQVAISVQVQEMQDILEQAFLQGPQRRWQALDVPPKALVDPVEDTTPTPVPPPLPRSSFGSARSSSTFEAEIDLDSSQLEADLQLFRRDVEEKGYLSSPVTQHLISRYHLDAVDLGSIIWFTVNVDDHPPLSKIDVAVEMLRTKIIARLTEGQIVRSSSSSSERSSILTEYQPELTWSSTLTGDSPSLTIPVSNPFLPGPRKSNREFYISPARMPDSLDRSYQPTNLTEAHFDRTRLTRLPVSLYDTPVPIYSGS